MLGTVRALAMLAGLMATSLAVQDSTGSARPTATPEEAAGVKLPHLFVTWRVAPGYTWRELGLGHTKCCPLGLDCGLSGPQSCLSRCCSVGLGPSHPRGVSFPVMWGRPGSDKSTKVTAGAGERMSYLCLPSAQHRPSASRHPLTCLAVPCTQGHRHPGKLTNGHRPQGLAAEAAARDSKKPQTTGRRRSWGPRPPVWCLCSSTRNRGSLGHVPTPL